MLHATELLLPLGEYLHRALESEATTRIDELLTCLLYTSDAADERSSVDLGGRRIITKKIQVNREVVGVVRVRLIHVIQGRADKYM